MSASLHLLAHDRLLVVAPHPDDETLAAGELIQSALAAGAHVRVLYATDGDNNPWPQRWLERRVLIGATERARWGQRRRAEANAALAALAIDGRSADARFLGWPDQGLTTALMRDDAAIDVLAAEISTFAPSHIVMPVLDDRHPDHSALHVMLDLALLRSAARCARYGYAIHGAEPPDVIHLDVVAQRQVRKLAALEAYASQLALSRNRLVALASRAERFIALGGTPAPIQQGQGFVRIDHARAASPLQRHDLLVVLATREGVLRFRGAWPRWSRTARSFPLADDRGRTLIVDDEHGALQLRLPPLSAPLLGVWVKLHRLGPRVIVFDRTPWHVVGVPRAASVAQLDPHVATEMG
jgi:LmbE family N-acetylglucosaminyl deacetylase